MVNARCKSQLIENKVLQDNVLITSNTIDRYADASPKVVKHMVKHDFDAQSQHHQYQVVGLKEFNYRSKDMDYHKKIARMTTKTPAKMSVKGKIHLSLPTVDMY